MILLNDHSLTPVRKVPLETMGLQLKERDSTASMVPADMTGISIKSWLKDDTEPGAGIVWRVKSIQQAYGTRTVTVQLEHMIQSLDDRIMFGEITPAKITGNEKATTCTAERAVRYILSYQSDWVLGAFEYGNVSNPYKFDGDSLMDALTTVSNSLQDAWWSYDMSVYPFRLNITRKTSDIGSEMRAGRNMKTITRTIDKSGMYTRFYPIGKDDLHMAGNYAEKNTAEYGVIEKVETDSTIETKEELARWASERLNLHAEPTVTIDVEGVELENETGVSLDKMHLGKRCRVPLPEFETEITERIVSMTYPDKIGQPKNVKIRLANNLVDVTKIIADAIKGGSSGKSGRTRAKKDKEDHAWFEDTNDHVAMCAKGIVGVDAQGNPNWVRLSEIIVNENGIESSVQSVQNGLVIANTKINQNENAITLEANRAKTAEGTLAGQISVQADKIGLVVTQKDGRNVVDAASIVLGINAQTGSFIKLQAKTIDINGIVNAMTAYNVTVETITTRNTAAFGGEVTFSEGAAFGGSDVTDITNLDAENATFDSLIIGSHEASWKSKKVVTGVTRGNTHRFVYSTDGSLQNLSTEWGTIVTAVDEATIYYLGR